MNKFIFILIIISFIALSLGVSLFLTGCHDLLKPDCFQYHKKEVIVFNYTLEPQYCQLCENNTQTGKEVKCNNNKECFTALIILKFNLNGTKYCNITYSSKKFENEEIALKSANLFYPLGKNDTMYVDGKKLECLPVEGFEILTITGFVFLIVFGIACLMLIIVSLNLGYGIWKKKKEEKEIAKVHDIQEEIHNELKKNNLDKVDDLVKIQAHEQKNKSIQNPISKNLEYNPVYENKQIL